MVKNFRDIEGVSRGADTFKIDPRVLKLDYSWNSRIDYGDLDALTEYIRENGVPGVILVFEKGGEIYVLDGFRRMTCVNNLIKQDVNIQTVNCLRVTSKNEADHLLLQLSANKSKNLSTLEEAFVYQKWLAYGGAIEDLAKKAGTSTQTIRNAIAFAETSPEIHRIVSVDDIKPTNALIAINATDTSSEASEVVSEAVALAKSEGKKRATKEHVEQALENRGKGTKKPNLKKHVESMVIGSPVKTTDDKVQVEFSRDEWTKLLEMLGIES